MSDADIRPMGRLFTEVYRDQGPPSGDDPRFRVQLEALFESTIERGEHRELARILKSRLGVIVKSGAGFDRVTYYFEHWFANAEIDDILNAVTCVAEAIPGATRRSAWIDGVARIFSQRNMQYEIDPKGGVHTRIDPAFQHSKQLTLSTLVGADLDAAHEELEKAFGYLTQLTPDTKMATVNAFLAAENVFKVVVNTKSDLSESEVSKSLMQVVQSAYGARDDATKQAAARLVSSFAKWASACHPYRHGQNESRIVAPPLEIAITLVTTGADYIRWLVELRRICTAL